MPENDELTCRTCGTHYYVHPDCEDTRYCDLCAQDIISEMSDLVPEPPNAITWEQGVNILNALQRRLYPK